MRELLDGVFQQGLSRSSSRGRWGAKADRQQPHELAISRDVADETEGDG